MQARCRVVTGSVTNKSPLFGIADFSHRDTSMRSSQLSPRRILIVDDDISITYALAKLLRRSGHAVEAAHEAVEAARVCVAFRPQLAIIDLCMPLLDGNALAKALRPAVAGGGMQLVAVTAFARNGDREAAIEAGFDLFFRKPDDLAELERMIVEGLEPDGPVPRQV